MSRTAFRSTLSPAQRRLADPIRIGSEKATVISISTMGVEKDYRQIPFCRLTVEMDEELGHPTLLEAWASLAVPLSELRVGDAIRFEGTAEGTMFRPKVVLKSFSTI